MINVIDKNKCCGCTACFSACSFLAITMKQDEEGFLYPVVNEEKCVRCGRCKQVCMYQDSLEFDTHIYKAYILRDLDEHVVANSTSGGFFSKIASYYLNKNAMVYSVVIDEEDFGIKHKCLTNQQYLKNSCGSKYVQSELGNTFSQIKKVLLKDMDVLFVGTPCQVKGLKLFLGRDYEKLCAIDVVCHGVPSPLLWKRYIEYMEKKFDSRCISNYISFRHKTYGYHSSTMRLKFENGYEYKGSARTDFMLKSFFSEICSRPSCYNCEMKNNNRVSDFTIFDCWTPEKTIGIKDDDKGYTNILVQSKKGMDILRLISDYYEMYEISPKIAISTDGDMVYNSAKPHVNRKLFYKYLSKYGLEKTICELIPITKKDYLVEKSKKCLYKVGVLKILKRLKINFWR